MGSTYQLKKKKIVVSYFNFSKKLSLTVKNEMTEIKAQNMMILKLSIVKIFMREGQPAQ